jgi:peroxiredoxin
MRISTRALPVWLLLLASLPGRSTLAQGANAALRPAKERKAAPELGLEDSRGKRADLKDYRGHVILLDFWATWCHGCKEEIPWFAEFERKYGEAGLRVVGVSLDDEGWRVVKPFIKTAAVPYRIVLGNDATAKAYGIGNMPDTFLIDRDGRIAAAYAGMVNRNSIEKNIEMLLAQ